MRLRTRLFGKNFYISQPGKIDKFDYTEYYPIQVECINCNSKIDLAVKKGVYLKEIIKSIKCSYCECNLRER